MTASVVDERLKGKHVLLVLLCFFCVVGVVNAIFIYSAISTKPGEERGASYEVGLRYNNILSEEHTQDALQWQHQTQIVQGERLRIAMTDKSGAPIAGLSLSGDFSRPASDKGDRSLVFKEVDAGLYEVALGKVDPGSWVLSFKAEKARPGAETTTFRVKERLWLSPAAR